MKRLLEHLTHNKLVLLFLSFFIPFFIYLYVVISLKITPFGDRTMMFSDGYAQYLPFISNFVANIKKSGNLFYTFTKGLGGNYINLIAYYLVNPFYLIFLFFDITKFPEAFTWVILLQTAFCGLTMYIFLSYLFGKKPHILIFSTIYALSGYPVVYNWHMMWINGVIILPLIALGIIKLVKDGKGLLYCLAMAYAIFTNFYIGFSLCIFSLIFFLSYYFYNESKSAKTIISYAAHSAVAGLLSAFIWIPTIISFKSGRLQQISFNDFMPAENMPFIDIATKLFPGTSTMNEYVSGLPNIYCTLFVVFLTILFFFSRKNSRRMKVAAGTLLTVYLLSFYIQTFSSVFQGFSHTNWFNFRYSFVFSFLLILISVYQYQNMATVPEKSLTKTFGIILITSILVFNKKIEYVSISLVLAELTLLTIIVYTYRFRIHNPKKAPYNVWCALTSICVFISLFLNAFFDSYKIKDIYTKNSDYLSNVMPTSAVVDGIKIADPSFYRMETEYRLSDFTGNDASLYGYNGFGSFTSTGQNEITKGLSRFGVSWYDMRNYYDKGTPDSMESFLGLRYLISKNDLSKEKEYKLVSSLAGLNTYKNPYSLKLANITASDIENIDYTKGNAFEMQNKIWISLSGENKSIFKPVNNISLSSHNFTEESENTFASINTTDPLYLQDSDEEAESVQNSDSMGSSLDNNEKSDCYNYYFEYKFETPYDGPIYMFDDNIIDSKSGTTRDFLQYIGTFKKGDTVTGKIQSPVAITKTMLKDYSKGLSFYCEDREVLKELSEIINSRDITCELIDSNKVSGTFTASDSQRVILTIPYDEGWTLKVDGKEVKLDKTLGIFMSFAAEEGKHTYEMTYVPVGFKEGVYISIGAIIAFIIVQIAEKFRLRKQRRSVSEKEDNTESGDKS